MKFYMFRTVPLSIIRNYSLYTQHWYMSYSFVDSFRAGSEWILILLEHPALAPNASTTTTKRKHNFHHHYERNNKITFTKQQKLQNMQRKQHQKQQERHTVNQRCRASAVGTQSDALPESVWDVTDLADRNTVICKFKALPVKNMEIFSY
jgi:hypothetical protein